MTTEKPVIQTSGPAFPSLKQWENYLHGTLENINRDIEKLPEKEKERMTAAITLSHEMVRAAWRFSPYAKHPLPQAKHLISSIGSSTHIPYLLYFPNTATIQMFQSMTGNIIYLYALPQTPTYASVSAAMLARKKTHEALQTSTPSALESIAEEIAIEAIEATPGKHTMCNLDFVTMTVREELVLAGKKTAPHIHEED